MKFLEASDVFESARFFYWISKICLFYFATIERDKNGFYTSKTKFLNFFTFLAYMIFGIYWSIDMMKKAVVLLKSRSLILELIVYAKCQTQVFQPFITLTVAFWYRHKIFEILKKIHRIDQIVRILLQKIFI